MKTKTVTEVGKVVAINNGKSIQTYNTEDLIPQTFAAIEQFNPERARKIRHIAELQHITLRSSNTPTVDLTTGKISTIINHFTMTSTDDKNQFKREGMNISNSCKTGNPSSVKTAPYYNHTFKYVSNLTDEEFTKYYNRTIQFYKPRARKDVPSRVVEKPVNNIAVNQVMIRWK